MCDRRGSHAEAAGEGDGRLNVQVTGGVAAGKAEDVEVRADTRQRQAQFTAVLEGGAVLCRRLPERSSRPRRALVSALEEVAACGCEQALWCPGRRCR